MKPFYFLSLLILIFNCGAIRGQEISHYSLSEGLSNIEITDIEENEHFLWIGTADGLNRFDGKQFKTFKYDSKKENSISENNIETLFFDSKGLLWIGLRNNGINIYDPQKDIFYHSDQIMGNIALNRVTSIYEDSNKNIWLGTWEQGLYQLIPGKDDPVSYTVKLHYPGYIVSSISEYPKGYVRIGTYSGLYTYDMVAKKWEDNNNHNLAITQILPQKGKSGLWCSTWWNGLLQISWDESNPSLTTTKELMAHDQSGSIHKLLNMDNNLYLGTWGKGLLAYGAISSGQLNQITTNDFNPSFINSLFTDNYQNTWIGTLGEGLYRLNNKTDQFYYHSRNNLPKPALALSSVSENEILVGTQGKGVFLYDFVNDTLLPQFDDIFTGNFKSSVLSIKSRGNDLLIGHDGSRMQVVTKKKKNHYVLNNYNFPEALEKVTTIYTEKDGSVWAGTKQKGLFSFTLDPKKKKTENFTHYEDFGFDGITSIAPFDQTSLFISSSTGLYLFNPISKEKSAILDEPVYEILHDKENQCLWIGTTSNLKQLSFSSMDVVNSVFPEKLSPKGNIRTLVLDSQNNLWFGAGERLYCYRLLHDQMREINPDLIGKKTLLSSCSFKSEGKEYLIFGTSQNLLVIEPENILEQADEPNIVLTELEIDHNAIGVGDSLYGKTILEVAPEYAHALELSHKSKWISFSFVESGWEIFNSSYLFRMKGFNDKWQVMDLDNPVTFSQLLPGKYTLEIRGYASEKPMPVIYSLDLNVTPPWWQTSFFNFFWNALLILGIAFLVWGLNYRYKRRQYRMLKLIEKQKKEGLLREKESFFSGLSHDFLTTFSLILAPLNDLIRENETADPVREKLKIIQKNTSFLSDIFGTIFDYKKAEFTDKRIKEKKVEIVSFSNSVVKAFEHLAISKNINLIFETKTNAVEVQVDTVKVERILFNLLSNAIRYTPESGRVSLSFDFTDENNLQFIVSDTGHGIELSKQEAIFEKFYRASSKQDELESKGLGLGLFIVKKFVDILNGTIQVESELKKGTKITVSIPAKSLQTLEEDSGNDFNLSLSDSKSTILIVEDNKELLDYTADKLRDHFNVIPAVSGQEALRYISTYLPEIILTDIMMPGLDGLSLTKAIKQDPRYSDIFVIILSAKSSSEDELIGYKQGADIYLKKPIDLEVLLNQLINIHKTRQKRKSQLISEVISKESNPIELETKDSFIQWAMKVINENIMVTGFSMDDFAEEMNISKSVLHRKFKLLVGQTPNQFIRLVRLRKSVDLLKNSELSISEVAYLSGFNQSHYFIKCFKEVYKETPKNYRKNVLKIP